MEYFKTRKGPAHCRQLADWEIRQLPCNPIPAESLSPCYWPYWEQSTQRPPRSWVKNGALCSTTGVCNWILGSLSRVLTDWIGTPISSTQVLIPLNPPWAQGWVLKVYTPFCEWPIITLRCIKQQQVKKSWVLLHRHAVCADGSEKQRIEVF